MWTDIRLEIERVRQELALTAEQFRPVGAEEWERIDRKVEEAFREPVPAAKRRPLLWTQLRHSLSTTVLSYPDGDEMLLSKLRELWQNAEPMFFFARESVQDGKTWWYLTDAATAWQVVEYLQQHPGPLEEYGFADRKYRWALFVNHSDSLIFCGEPLVSRTKQLNPQTGVRIQ